MRIFIYQPTGSVYWFEEGYAPLTPAEEWVLMYAPITAAGFVNFEEGGAVEEDLIGSEDIGRGDFKTFHELYEYLRSMRVKGLL